MSIMTFISYISNFIQTQKPRTTYHIWPGYIYVQVTQYVEMSMVPYFSQYKKKEKRKKE